jgi:hypothetical protein
VSTELSKEWGFMDTMDFLNVGDFRENINYLKTKMIAMAGESETGDLEEYISRVEDILKI